MPGLRRFFEAITEDLFSFNLTLIPFGLLIGMAERDIGGVLMLLLFIPLLLYYYFLRVKIKKLSLFLFLSWLPCVIGLFMPHPIIHTFFIGFLASRNVRRRTSAEAVLCISFELLCFPLTFLAAVYIVSPFIDMTFIRPFIYGQATALLLLALIYTHLKGINNELELDYASALGSTKAVTAFANKALAVYIAGFLAVLLLFRFVPFGYLAVFIGRFIIKLLRLLFANISSDTDDVIATPIQGNEEVPMDLALEEAPMWMQIIEQILIYAINLFALSLIVLFIAFFCLRLYRGFYRKRDERLYYNDRISEIKPLKRQKGNIFFKPLPKDSIRRKYYKKLNRHFKKHRFNRADTPLEIQEKLRDKENLSKLTPLYESTRYNKKD